MKELIKQEAKNQIPYNPEYSKLSQGNVPIERNRFEQGATWLLNTLAGSEGNFPEKTTEYAQSLFDKPDVKTEGLNYYEILAWLEMIKTNFIVSRLDKDTPKEENTDTTTTPSQKQ